MILKKCHMNIASYRPLHFVGCSSQWNDTSDGQWGGGQGGQALQKDRRMMGVNWMLPLDRCPVRPWLSLRNLTWSISNWGDWSNSWFLHRPCCENLECRHSVESSRIWVLLSVQNVRSPWLPIWERQNLLFCEIDNPGESQKFRAIFCARTSLVRPSRVKGV